MLSPSFIALALYLKTAAARALRTPIEASPLATKAPSRRDESAAIPTFTFGPESVYFPAAVRINLSVILTALTSIRRLRTLSLQAQRYRCILPGFMIRYHLMGSLSPSALRYAKKLRMYERRVATTDNRRVVARHSMMYCRRPRCLLMSSVSFHLPLGLSGLPWQLSSPRQFTYTTMN